MVNDHRLPFIMTKCLFEQLINNTIQAVPSLFTLIAITLKKIKPNPKSCKTWAAFFTLNMGLINKVDMVCLSPVGYGV